MVACLPCLWFAFLPPIPPAPFPGGEGGDQGYFMQGASPLAFPALNRLRHLQTLPCRYPGTEPLAAQAELEKQAPSEGLSPALPVDTAAVMFAWAACLLGRLPAPPLVLILPPFPEGEGYPPDPRSQSALPRRGRGRPRLFHARGFAPCIPSIKPLAAQAEPEKQAPGRGLLPALPADTAAVMFAWAACLLGRLPPLPLAFFVAPIPPPPSPAGKGETLKLFCRGLPPPAPRHLTVCGIYRPCHAGTPALNRLRHRLNLRSRHPARACPRRCRLPLSCRCPVAEPGRH